MNESAADVARQQEREEEAEQEEKPNQKDANNTATTRVRKGKKKKKEGSEPSNIALVVTQETDGQETEHIFSNEGLEFVVQESTTDATQYSVIHQDHDSGREEAGFERHAYGWMPSGNLSSGARWVGNSAATPYCPASCGSMLCGPWSGLSATPYLPSPCSPIPVAPKPVSKAAFLAGLEAGFKKGYEQGISDGQDLVHNGEGKSDGRDFVHNGDPLYSEPKKNQPKKKRHRMERMRAS